MTTRNQIILTLVYSLYSFAVLLTDYSLTGFWTDVIFSVLFSILSLRLIFKNQTDTKWLTLTLRRTTSFFAIIILGLLGLNLINPFSWDTLKLQSFYFQKVDGRLFNAYFKPVGAYAGGYGNFWITETSTFFPIIEREIYYDRTVDYDFNDDNWEGKLIDNQEVVKTYIKDEVINKQK